jgi:hypothetical protein
MINIEVNLFAIYGVLAGEKVLTISAEQPLTVRTAVEQIVRKHSGLITNMNCNRKFMFFSIVKK